MALYVLHPPTHPTIVVDGISFERFVSHQFRNFSKSRLRLVRLEDLDTRIWLLQQRFPVSGERSVNKPLRYPLQVVNFLKSFAIPDVVRRRVSIIQHEEGAVGLSVRRY